MSEAAIQAISSLAYTGITVGFATQITTATMRSTSKSLQKFYDPKHWGKRPRKKKKPKRRKRKKRKKRKRRRRRKKR